MISRLSDLLRLTFDRSGAPRVSLQEELEFLQKYLEIEQTRFQDRLTVQFDIDPETLDAEVPRLILQPLVENAIKHGVVAEARRRPGADRVAAAADDTLWLEVSDNGVGLSAGARARLAQRRRPLEHARSARVPLRRRAPASSSPTGTSGLAVRLEIPFHRVAARHAARPRSRSHDDDERCACGSSSPTTSRSRASGCARCSHAKTGSRSSPSARTAPRPSTPSGSLQPDLVFLDVQMPGASGFEVIEAVGPARMPLVVFVTAFDQLRAARVRRPRARLPAQAVRPRALPARRWCAPASSSSGATTGDLERRLLELVQDLKPAAAAARAVRDQGRRPRVLRPLRRDRLDRGGGQLRQAARRHRRASASARR